MRLICPKCSAQYEVDDAAIPDSGREVQCSACGDIWFQPGAALTPAPLPLGQPAGTESGDDPVARAISRIVSELETPAGSETPPAAGPAPIVTEQAQPAELPPDPDENLAPDDFAETAFTETTTESDSLSPVSPEPEAVGTEATAAKPADPADALAALSAATAALRAALNDGEAEPPAPPRRPLDSNVLSILREEAERETEARRAEGSLDDAAGDAAKVVALHTPLHDAPASAPRAEPPLTREAPPAPAPSPTMRGLPDFSDLNSPDAPVSAETAPGSLGGAERSADDLPPPPFPPELPPELPDAAALASTLAAAQDRRDAPPQEAVQAAPQGSGFRTGFFGVLLIAALGTLLYIYAGALAALVPPLAPTLDIWVGWVDAGRIWFNHTLIGAIATLVHALRG
ncbi:zinc-ribbon domain-containing protein [Paenirhodobacter enshiensis]|uniref:Zinc finger/thioredoxin putative domain-containing protein n=1 Tax=Paenirhodobacter enshiensis TaxID=1105367 RepID=A0A086XSC5_9RHOB|nr:zinc-ribbon domain-containing protein [Paenirhodobacter enshiensis]KFI24925.1 hypothetical protein CG50_07280 [Paenirhodobacter enshiensis]